MDARSIISRMRDKADLSRAQLEWFANGLANGDVSDAQAGAFAMAVFLNGMTEQDRVGLTRAMRDSGDVLHWDLPGPIIDKHSTGGIGDCVSLLLAPALASLGAYVPMVSGRGLGHTGGTLDKLEAIPGLRTEVSQDRFRQIVANVGTAIVSATSNIAPADKRLYAVRDVTGTVESIDLITASILSKKLAAGLDALVLDVKVGTGAFMKDIDEASELAEALVSTANGAGCKTSALITDMNQPCATSVGNALEIMDVMEALTGARTDSVLCDVTAALGGELLVLAGMADDAQSGAEQVQDCFADGAAAERFGQMITELGGPADFIDRWSDRLPAAPVVLEVLASDAGFVTGMDGQALGLAVVDLGGGRHRGDDVIDPSVGLSDVSMLGDRVDRHTPLATIHAATEDAAKAAAVKVHKAYRIEDTQHDVPPTVYRSVR
ncbi:MAG: thymidine phosphorylase [Marinosulfonomonas sp.]